MRLLITGGAGFIGSHTVLCLLEKGHDLIVVDNLSNSSVEALRRVEALTGRKIKFYEIDICNYQKLESIFVAEQHIDAVIHFAGLKSVSESNLKPLEYYECNVQGTINLLKVMRLFNIDKFIFSSSATVYGIPEYIPINESHPIGRATNPYGETKCQVERILIDCSLAYSNLDITILRYFNPIGAHPSGMIGENPRGIPNNLLPYISKVAIGEISHLNIYGDDFNTKDGTGIRDYIHVMDLAEGHLNALNAMGKGSKFNIYNLGTGCGYSVFEVLNEFQKITGITIPFKVEKRREGDVDECWADASLALEKLNWKAKRTLTDMIKDLWCWQTKNPYGF